MKIREIKYQRVKNLGKYESERLELTAELDDGDDVETAIDDLKAEVLRSLELDNDEGEVPY